MNWNTFFVTFIILLTVGLIVRGGPKAAFYLMTALVPATGFYVDLGVSFTASKVIGLILYIALVRLWIMHGIVGKAESLGLAFLIYAAIATIAGTLFAPVPTLESNEFRVLMRPVVQWLALALQMLPLFVAPLILRSKADVSSTAKAFFWGCGLLALGGVLQWIIHETFDVNIFPIYREGLFGEALDVGEFAVGEDIIFRANSLAREPKDMGAALAIAATVWMFLRSASMIQSFSLSSVFVGTLLLAIVLSFSTTAAFLLGIGVVMVAMVSIVTACPRITNISRTRATFHRAGNAPMPMGIPLKPFVAVFLVGVAIAGPLAWFDNIQGMMPSFSDILTLRVLDRIGEIEDYDQVALDFLADETHWAVFGVGAGNLPWYGFSYLPGHPDYSYMYNLTWNAKSGLLNIITSYGVIGLVICTCIVGTTTALLLSVIYQFKNINRLATWAVIGVVIFISIVHAFRVVDDIFWLVLGVGIAYARTSVMAIVEVQAASSKHFQTSRDVRSLQTP